MRRKKKPAARAGLALPVKLSRLARYLVISLILISQLSVEVNSLLLLKSNCLANAPKCECLWKGGKFVVDCSSQQLKTIPKNDYNFDLQTGNEQPGVQLATLNRDLQQLNLSSNNLTSLGRDEFLRKKFSNLQKIFLNSNQIARIHSSAFYKLIGLIELDLSENFISKLEDQEEDLRGEGSSWTGSDKGPRAKLKSKTFLQHLGPLRQLNLTSNLLQQLEAFSFSPLTQLRQLDLSR